jgi:hypothetical protein
MKMYLGSYTTYGNEIEDLKYLRHRQPFQCRKRQILGFSISFPSNLIAAIRLIKFSVHYFRKKVFKFEKGDIQTQIHVYVLLTFIYI